jgi:CrcB protein
MIHVLLIALFGGLGSVCRYLVGLGVRKIAPEHIPVGTLAVNLLGCFAIGLLFTLLQGRAPDQQATWRAALAVGFLGGFTTFSAFGLETATMLSRGQTGQAVAYIVTSVGAGLAAVWVGHWAAS